MENPHIPDAMNYISIAKDHHKVINCIWSKQFFPSRKEIFYYNKWELIPILATILRDLANYRVVKQKRANLRFVLAKQ